MKDKPTAELIEEAREKYEKACAMVSALCKRKGEPGAREWIMSIPARPDHDPDLVISDALHVIVDLVDRLELVDKPMVTLGNEYGLLHAKCENLEARLAEAERVIDNMRAERDANQKARSLLVNLVKGLRIALLWSWYVFGIGGSVALYYYPIPASGVQGFALLGWFALFSLMSKATYKIKDIEARVEP